MHIEGRVFMENFDGPGASLVVGWHPSQPCLTDDGDSDVEVIS
jgi:hypothetical protein